MAWEIAREIGLIFQKHIVKKKNTTRYQLQDTHFSPFNISKIRMHLKIHGALQSL